jgi:hypothetical protein
MQETPRISVDRFARSAGARDFAALLDAAESQSRPSRVAR